MATESKSRPKVDDASAEVAAAIPDRPPTPRPSVPLPVAVVAGQRAVRTRAQREHMMTIAYFKDDTPGHFKVTLSLLPKAGVVECRHTIAKRIKAGRFPKPDGHDGTTRKRPWWRLETLRRFSTEGR